MSITWPEFQCFTGTAGMSDPMDLSRSSCVPKASNSPDKNSDIKIRSLSGNSHLESRMLSRDVRDAFPSPLPRSIQGLNHLKCLFYSLKICNFTGKCVRSVRFFTQELRGGSGIEFNVTVSYLGKIHVKTGLFLPR